MGTRRFRLLTASLVLGASACVGVACSSNDSSQPANDPSDGSIDGNSGIDVTPNDDARTSDGAADGSGDARNGDGGQDGEAGPSPSCPSGPLNLTRRPVYAEVMLDGSRRMDGMVTSSGALVYAAGAREVDSRNPARPTIPDGSGDTSRAGQGTQGVTGKKWLAARGALDAAWNRLYRDPADRTFAVGFHVINSTTVVPDTALEVPIAAVDAAQMARLQDRIAPRVSDNGTTSFPIGNVYPNGDLPLRSAIFGEGTRLFKFDPSSAGLPPNGKRYLVLIVNGRPSDDLESNADGTVQVVANLRTGNPAITTFVIGVGDPSANPADYNEVILGHLAQAGGGALPNCNPNWAGETTSTPCHYQITPGTKSASELTSNVVNALLAIQDRVDACDFALPPNGSPDSSAIQASIYVSGSGAETLLARDAANGWTYFVESSGPRIVLHGTACANLKADRAATIRLVLGCSDGGPGPIH